MRIKDKEELAARIRESADFTADQKSQLLGLLNEAKPYGLVWEDKPEDAMELLRAQLPVLREVPARRLLSDDSDAPNHILIEGDNLHALAALSYAYEGQVDVIYIDPPYNTGNKDFTYNDAYVDVEDTYKHSKWLSFMRRRLEIAIRFLSPKGVIFISIDDNEQASLKIICDELFKAHNFIGQLIIETATDNNPRQISTEHEYMLCYAKNKDNQDYWTRKNEAAQRIQKQYQRIKAKETACEKIQEQLRLWIKANQDVLPQVTHYDNVDEKGVFHDGDIANTKMGGYKYEVIHPFTGKPCRIPEKGFRFPENTMREMIANNDILFGPDENTLIKPKKRIENAKELLRSVIYEDGRAATKIVDTILHRGAFNNPKSVNILRKLIDFTSRKDSLILDFFAGSGTTLHATMQLNKEDGGHRRCILVTNNENHICEEVTYERNKRVIQGYTTPKGEQVAGLTANNLRYYQIDFIERRQTNENRAKLMVAATDVLCMKENLYAEQDSFGGMILPKKAVRYFQEGERRMLIIYNPAVIPYLAKAIAREEKTDESIQVYVMSEGQYPYTDDFAGVLDRVTLHAMPASLYQAYRQVLPKRPASAEIEGQPEVSEQELASATTDIFKSEDYD